MRPLLFLIPVFVLAAFGGWGIAVSNGADRSPAAATAAPASDSDAAARRHAKRTGCLKDAKARKLIGAQKAAFLKECLAAAHP